MKKLFTKKHFISAMVFVFLSACSVEQVLDNSKTYIITFDSRGGTPVFAQAVKMGENADEPASPTRTDYVFGGWYKESECSNAWAFSSDTVISNTILYAKWIETIFACVVTFDSCGGTVVPAQVIKSGDKVIEPAHPAKIDCIFSGWYQETQCSNTWSFSSNTVVSNIVLFAKWIDAFILTFVFNGVGYTITGCDSGATGALFIPEKIYGLPVTSIANYAFNGYTGLTSVIIPNSVTSIGNNTFQGCTGLTSVTIPDSVTSIANYAFNGCTGLTSVTIPNSVTSMGVAVFRACIGLTSITIPNSLTTIPQEGFYDCLGLTSISIPNSVTIIQSFAFNRCIGLNSFTIPDSLIWIGSYAFNLCTNINDFYFEPTNAPTVFDTSFNIICGCTLHLKPGASGYNINPWTNSIIFSSVITDL